MRKKDIEAQLMILEPEGTLEGYCSTIRDIYENRYIIRELPYKDWIVERIATIILSTIKNKKRFRQLPCLKVLQSIVKDKYSPSLSKSTISILYEIYRNYIFHGNTDYEWCVSSLLKGRELKFDEIEWFVNNWSKSEYLINRLLRYPTNNLQITNWAKERYSNRELSNRNSELIARFITEDFSCLLQSEKSAATLTWAVYYSLTNPAEKNEMLIQIASLFDEENLIEVCSRLRLSEPLKVMLKVHHALEKIKRGQARIIL